MPFLLLILGRTIERIHEMTIEEMVFHPDMLLMDPNGYKVFEGWNGFFDADFAMHGSPPRYIFSEDVNEGIDTLQSRMRQLTRGTVHNAVSVCGGRLAVDKIPQRGGCFGTHQLMTAFSGMPLIYREGFCFKFSKNPVYKNGAILQKKINPETGELQNWISPHTGRYTISFFYHGWCWNEQTKEIVDITQGPHSGLSDGFIIPMIWKSYGNSANKSHRLMSNFWSHQWARQRQLVKSSIKKTRKHQRMTGDYSVNNTVVAKGFEDCSMWHPMADIGYSRNAFYRGLHAIVPELKNRQDILKMLHPRMPKSMIQNFDEVEAFRMAHCIVLTFWQKRHARVQNPIAWNAAKAKWSEPTKPYFPQFVLDLARAQAAA